MEKNTATGIQTHTTNTGNISSGADINQEFSTLDNTTAFKKLFSLALTRPAAVREALLVALSNSLPITMYGYTTLMDKTSQEAYKEVYKESYEKTGGKLKDGSALRNTTSFRTYLDIHPYRKAGSGTNSIATYTDEKGEIYVLMGRKFANFAAQGEYTKTENARKTVPEDLISKQYIFLGGYFQPHGLEGSERITTKKDDVIEEAILVGRDSKSTSPTIAKVEKEPPYDADLKISAIRELEEESGLKIGKGVDIMPLKTRSEYGFTNDPRLHTIVQDYLFDFGTRTAAPATQRGDDIAEVKWVNIRDIVYKPEIGTQPYGSTKSRYTYNGINIRDDHGVTFEAGMEHLRNKAIQKASQIEVKSLYHSPENVLARLDEILASKPGRIRSEYLFGPTPATHAGNNATAWHKSILDLATLLTLNKDTTTILKDIETAKPALITRLRMQHNMVDSVIKI